MELRTISDTPPPAVSPHRRCTGDTAASPRRQPVLGPSEMPYRQLHLRPLTDQGSMGPGSGSGSSIPASTRPTRRSAASRSAAQHDFVFNDNVVRNEPADVAGAQSHGTSTWSLVRGRGRGRLHGITRARASCSPKPRTFAARHGSRRTTTLPRSSGPIRSGSTSSPRASGT